MRHLVRQLLHGVRAPAGLIVYDHVVGGGDRPLSHVLGHQEEVIPRGQRERRA